MMCKSRFYLPMFIISITKVSKIDANDGDMRVVCFIFTNLTKNRVGA